MKFGFWLIITTGVAVASAFTKDTGHMLALVVLMSVWLLIGVPIGMWLLKLAKASYKPEPVKQLTELEQLWLEVGPPDQPMAPIWNPPSHTTTAAARITPAAPIPGPTTGGNHGAPVQG